MRTKIWCLLIVIMLFAAALSACKSSDKQGNLRADVQQKAGSISSRRAGIYNQSVPYSGRFAVSDHGIYTLNTISEGTHARRVLLYSDLGSDVFSYVCSRPDCTHIDKTCDAYLDGADVITYIDEHIYYAGMFARSESDPTFSMKIMRADADGRNCVEVIDIGAEEPFKQGNLGFEAFADGVFYFMHHWVDENGNQQGQSYCYKLDGSMQTPQAVDVPLVYGSDGAETFFWFPSNPVEYFAWNPEEMSVTPLFTLDPETSCYMATENAFIMTDNKIYKKDYDTGEETLLFDTGLEGTHRMICFPDCIVIRNAVAYDGSEPELKQQTLRFYSWEFEPLGEITLDFALLQGTSSPICAETPDKLLICTDISGIPRYYIDKSEFGTGHITLHEFKLPMGFQQ